MTFKDAADMYFISIHTLRVEGDEGFYFLFPLYPISIHTLRVEGDGLRGGTCLRPFLFQSTPSVWRATSILWRANGQ